MSEHLVKGSHVLQAQRWIDDRIGAGSYKRLTAPLDAKHAGLILPGQWYDIAPLISALEHTSKQCGIGLYEMTTAIAERNAREDLPTIYRVFVKVLSPTRLLSQATQLWSTYVRFATATALTNDRGHFVGEGTGIPNAFLKWAQGGWNGFLPAAVTMTGGKNVRGAVLSESMDERTGLARFKYEMHYD